MSYVVHLFDKDTGESYEAVQAEARANGVNFKAIVSWNTMTKIEFGETEGEAMRNAVEAFKRIPLLSNFEIRLGVRGC